MPVTINARGTSIPFFTIGKKGVTIFQGSSDPKLTYTIKNGDIWINDSTHAISSWYSGTSSWGPPAAGYLNFPTADGTSGQVLATNALGQLSFVNRVSTLSVATANGFAGTVSNPTTTPQVTITTSVTGVLKGNGTAISAATVGTDYSVGTSALGTGILKSTTSTGALTIAVAADFPTLNQNTTGTASNVTGVVAIANGGSGDTGTAWIGSSAAFSPTLGAFGNASGSYWYKRYSRTTVFINMSLSIISNGTGGGSVQMTLPFSCNNGAILVGREDAATGNALAGRISPGTSVVNIFTYSNGYPGANGAVIRMTGVYETSDP